MNGPGTAWYLALAAFLMERRARRNGRVDAFTLPAATRVVDSAVNPLGKEAHGIRDTQLDKLPVQQHV